MPITYALIPLVPRKAPSDEEERWLAATANVGEAALCLPRAINDRPYNAT